MVIRTKKDITGTSFHDVTITVSLQKLIDTFGEADYNCNDGSDKVNFEWNFENEDGEVFTLYDWKEYRPLKHDEIITWHIGAKSKYISVKAKYELEQEL